MQQSDDQRRTSRPSLLSEQPTGGESQSILSKLDGRAAPPKVKRSTAQPGRKPGMIAGVAAVLLAGGGALAWLLQDGAPERQVVAAPVVAAPAVATPVATTPAAPPPLVLAEGPRPPAPAPAPEPEVSAATILDEVPAAAAPAPKDELTTMLDKPAAPQAKEDKPKTVAAKDEEPAKPAAREKTEPVKVARQDKKPVKDRKTAVAAAPKKKPAAKAEPSVDSDVALLAALLAHSKANAAPKVSKTASEYKRCGTLGSVAEADKCRERLCEASSKAKAECKTLRVAKVSS